MDMYVLSICAILICVCMIVGCIAWVKTLASIRSHASKLTHATTETLEQIQPVIQKLDATLDDIQPAIKELQPLEQEARLSFCALNAQLEQTGAILENVREVSGTAAGVTHSVAGVAQGALSALTNTATSVAQNFIEGYSASKHMMEKKLGVAHSQESNPSDDLTSQASLAEKYTDTSEEKTNRSSHTKTYISYGEDSVSTPSSNAPAESPETHIQSNIEENLSTDESCL